MCLDHFEERYQRQDRGIDELGKQELTKCKNAYIECNVSRFG